MFRTPFSNGAVCLRRLAPCLTLLTVAACDSGFDPLPPVVPEARFTLDLRSPDRAIPGTVPVSGSCGVLLGGVRDDPDQIILKVDGAEAAAAPGSEIEAQLTLNSVGRHTLAVECRFEDHSDSEERTVEVVEPALVTVHLRNFTQADEPFVRDEGPITFAVGTKIVTSDDSAVVAVMPDSEYKIRADHPDFVLLWGRVADHETGELIGFYHVRDQTGAVYVHSRRSIDVFKIRESDITSIPNTQHDTPGDSTPFYSVDDLRQTLYDEYYAGVMNRIAAEKVTVWLPGVDLQRASPARAAIQKMFVVVGPNHISSLTSGVVQFGELTSETTTPAVRPLIEIRFGSYGDYVQVFTERGEISHSMISLQTASSLETTTANLLKAIGLRGTIGYDYVDDLVDGQGIPSPFARLALKILYSSPPGARF